MSRTEPSEQTQSQDQRQRLLMVLALILVGGVLLGRVWAAAFGAEPAAKAETLLAGLRVETDRRPVDLELLDLPLEQPARAGATTQVRALGQAMKQNDVVVLNFWATWCPPCLEELRSLYQFAGHLQGRSVRILAVSYDDGWAEQREAWKRHLGTDSPGRIQWLRDPAGQDGDPRAMLRLRMGTEKLPETWVIRDGQIVVRFVGGMDWTDPRILAYFDALTGSGG